MKTSILFLFLAIFLFITGAVIFIFASSVEGYETVECYDAYRNKIIDAECLEENKKQYIAIGIICHFFCFISFLFYMFGRTLE
jgi:hypothetical protein